MALIDELKEKLELVEATIAGHDADISEHRAAIEDLLVQRADLDIAMAALDPETYGDEDEAIPDEPELFDDAAADKSEFAESDDTQASSPSEPGQNQALTVAATSPGEAEESRDQFEEEAQRAAAIELTADVEPVASSWIDQQTCEPIDPTLRAFQDDHIVEPEPTEGYAPVTNPEADALAKAHDYYSPEKVAERNRFNPWGIFKREPEEVS
jgi:hypothetical protein